MNVLQINSEIAVSDISI